MAKRVEQGCGVEQFRKRRISSFVPADGSAKRPAGGYQQLSKWKCEITTVPSF